LEVPGKTTICINFNVLSKKQSVETPPIVSLMKTVLTEVPPEV